MSRPLSYGCSMIAFTFALMASVPVAGAHDVKSGGAAFQARPQVEKLECVQGKRPACPRGELLKLRGEGLERTSGVVFLGGPGRRDDRRGTPEARSPHRVIVRVPEAAKTGSVRVISRAARSSRASRRQLRVTPAPAADPQLTVTVPAGEGVFPVRGTHNFGTATNRFGGGRGHKGQDVFATCGTPIVAARSGVVTITKFQDRAGNYVVITADDGTSQAYMHMLEPATVTRGARIAAGQPVGQVGETGRATGCHLHYESWTAPGWYQGGRAIDPLPELQAFAARG